MCRIDVLRMREGDQRQPPKSEPWRPIPADQVTVTCVSFLMDYRGVCDNAVELIREGGSLIFWCKVCQDLRTYQIIGEEDAEHLSSSA